MKKKAEMDFQFYPIKVKVKTIVQPLWDDREIDFCRVEAINYFRGQSLREKERGHQNLADSIFRNGALASPYEFALEAIEFLFLTRTASPIILDLLPELYFDVALGIQNIRNLPFTACTSFMGKVEGLGLSDPAPDWPSAKGLRIAIKDVKIPSLVPFNLTIFHGAIRDDLDPFRIRTTLLGNLTIPA